MAEFAPVTLVASLNEHCAPESSELQLTRLRIRFQHSGPAADIVVFGLPVSLAVDEAVMIGRGPLAAATASEIDAAVTLGKRAS